MSTCCSCHSDIPASQTLSWEVERQVLENLESFQHSQPILTHLDPFFKLETNPNGLEQHASMLAWDL